jgi:GNAT superfamily N-acetyltransferase
MLCPVTTDIVVREALPDDWQVLRDLRLRSLQESPDAFGSTYEREAAFTEAEWRGRLSGQTGTSVLAWVDGTPVGIGGGYLAEEGWLQIVAMWTEPGLRGRGVGPAVLTSLVSWADARGLRVRLDVEADNAGARRVYERAGFVATGVTRPLREGAEQQCGRMVLTEDGGLSGTR